MAKETGKQRRARLIREHICTACGQRKARKRDGKWLTECQHCADYYKRWAKDRMAAGKKASKPAKKKPARKAKKVRRPHALGSNPVAVVEVTPQPTE